MAHFAPVAPIQILQDLLARDSRDLFGKYHLFLAHHTVEHPREFSKLIRDYYLKQPPRRLTVIMDNSIVELGGAVDDNMIHEAVEIVEQNIVDNCTIPCLPDVMGDGPGTVELSGDAYHRWIERKMPGDGYMLVTQGKNWDEFVELVDYFFISHKDMYKYINWVGVPRVLVNTSGSRRKAIEYIQMVAPQVRIHLLGFSNNMVDDFLCAKMPLVEGIDSAVPVRYDGLLKPTTFVEKRDPTWMDDGQLTQANCSNIRNVRTWVQRLQVSV